jgi:hypothetical protein
VLALLQYCCRRKRKKDRDKKSRSRRELGTQHGGYRPQSTCALATVAWMAVAVAVAVLCKLRNFKNLQLLGP